jgi:hypothetical protein
MSEVEAPVESFESTEVDIMGQEYFPEDFTFGGEETAEEIPFQEETVEELVEEPAPVLTKSFKVGEKEYNVDENTIRNFFRIKPEEKLDQATFNRYVTGYKEHIGRSTLATDLNQTKQTMELLMKTLKEDPAKVLELAGYNPKELAESILYKHLEEDLMDPSEKEKMTLKRENERLMKLEEERQRQELEIRQKQELEQAYQTVTQEIISALDTNPDLPKTPNTIRRAMFYMAKAMEKNIPISVSQVMPLVREDIETENLAILKNATPEMLEKFLGEQKLKEIRQYDISRVKKQTSAPKTREVQREVKPQYLDSNEFRNMVQEKMAKALKF